MAVRLHLHDLLPHPFEHGGGVTKSKSDKIVMRSYDVCAAGATEAHGMLKAAPNAFGTAACVPWEPIRPKREPASTVLLRPGFVLRRLAILEDVGCVNISAVLCHERAIRSCRRTGSNPNPAQ